MSTVSEIPRRPADAYLAMAKLLDPRYFVTSPPEMLARLEVTGADGVPTWWEFANGAIAVDVTAAAQAAGLSVRPLVVRRRDATA
jgi:hypothetical protein